MGDDCVALLEKILAETIRLRESMEARDAERLRLLKELRSKLDRENADPVMPRIKNNRKRKRNDVITQQCLKKVADSFRRMLVLNLDLNLVKDAWISSLACLDKNSSNEKIPPEKFAIYFCGSLEEALMQAEDIFPSGKNKEKFSKNSNCSCREFKKALVKIVKNPNVKWGMKNQEVDEEGEDDLDNEDEEEETKDDSEEELESEEEEQKADKKFKRSKHNQESSFEETLDEESSEDYKVEGAPEIEEPKKKKTKTQQETPQVKDAGEKKEEVQEKSKDKPDEVGKREKARERAEREKCKEAEKRERERRISTPPTVEEILDKMNYDLVMSLTVEAPDVPKCLKIITQISEMKINPDVIRKNQDIVQTIKRIRNYKQNSEVREKATQLYTQFKSLFKVTGSESAADRLLSTPSSDPSSSLNTTTSAEGNERTEPEAVKDSLAQVSVKSEENTQLHPTPTENGSEHNVSSVEPKVEDQENRTKECIPEEKRPELDTSVDNLTPQPMEIQNDSTEM